MTNNEIKAVKALNLKKNRDKEDVFCVEGNKLIQELLENSPEIIKKLYLTEPLYTEIDYELIKHNELERISSLKTPNTGIAVCKKLDTGEFDYSNSCLIVDMLQDPGNLGTIIRTAEWFGVTDIILSNGSVDVYNPKVIQSSMGSFFRTNVFYKDLHEFIPSLQAKVYACSLDGDNIYKQTINREHFSIVLGNESKGISPEIMELCSNKIFIPRFGNAESLNVGIAAGIILAEFKRN
jgi:RNA methyltransferase, TrmH family